MFVQFLVFPPVARRYGILNCFKACALTYPLVYILTPFTSLFPTSATKQGAMLAIMLLKSICGIFAFPCSTILLTNSAVSLRILGTLNGVATSISAIGRAAGPAIGGASFSLGVDIGYVILPWWILATLAAIGSIPIWFLVEMPGFAGDESDESDDDDDEEAVPHLPDTDILAGDEVIEEEDQDEFPDAPKFDSKTNTTVHTSAIERRMSSPIGFRDGVGGTRRLSSNLGPTNNGFGAGGTSYN